MTNIDREIGEIQANIKNIKDTAEIHQGIVEATTTRIETAITDGFKEQARVNRSFDKRIKWVKDRLIWLIVTLVATGVLGGGALKIFGG